MILENNEIKLRVNLHLVYMDWGILTSYCDKVLGNASYAPDFYDIMASTHDLFINRKQVCKDCLCKLIEDIL
jgi:hypothetical protein